MPRVVSLAQSASVVLDGGGSGTAEIGPTLPGEVWAPGSCSVTCTGPLPVTGAPTLYLYAGNGISNSTFIDSTFNVTGASSSMIAGKQIYPGQNVYAVWSNATPGETATLAVNGTRRVP